MRNISFALTTEQIRESVRRAAAGLPPVKDVTRRVGWKNLKVGERLQACEKCQGLKPGEYLVKLAVIEVVSVTREPLNALTGRCRGYFEEQAIVECKREGFPDLSPRQFVTMFCGHMAVRPASVVTRIEFKYILRCCFGACTSNQCAKASTWSSTFNGKHTGLTWCDAHVTNLTDNPQTPGHAVVPIVKPLPQ